MRGQQAVQEPQSAIEYRWSLSSSVKSQKCDFGRLIVKFILRGGKLVAPNAMIRYLDASSGRSHGSDKLSKAVNSDEARATGLLDLRGWGQDPAGRQHRAFLCSV